MKYLKNLSKHDWKEIWVSSLFFGFFYFGVINFLFVIYIQILALFTGNIKVKFIHIDAAIVGFALGTFLFYLFRPSKRVKLSREEEASENEAEKK
jgi:Na+/H+-dicarboxylate symporter